MSVGGVVRRGRNTLDTEAHVNKPGRWRLPSQVSRGLSVVLTMGTIRYFSLFLL